MQKFFFNHIHTRIDKFDKKNSRMFCGYFSYLNIILFITYFFLLTASFVFSIMSCSVKCITSVSARVIALHTYKPLDTETILNACRETGAVVTCENHHLIGGLGSEIATLLMQPGQYLRF